jgi:CheY-like chemotaxis protein
MKVSLNILVTEDNPDDLFLLQAAFERAGVSSRLEAVSDGVEALAYLKGNAPFEDRNAHPFPDLLLLDLNMPRRNGFEVLEWVRGDSQCSRLMVHVLTASPREADVERAYELGANSYVTKPSRLDELVAFVKALHQWHSFTVLAQPQRARGILTEAP